LRPYLNEKTNWKVIYPILIIAGSGMGVLNEIVEFTAVLLVPDTGVGGYGNTLLDLIFNTLGATAAVIFIHFKRKNKKAISISPSSL
jgi:glycopeptide antibiotics resistance protein